MTNEELHETLNTLIRVLRDGRGFYADAARRVDNRVLKSLFREMADRRGDIIEDLNYRVLAHGGRPSQIGTATGALSELYSEAKANLSLKNETALISSLEVYESRSLDTLKEAVKKRLPEPDHRALIRHVGDIQMTHDRLRAIKRRLS